MRLSVINPIEMAAYLDHHLQRQDTRYARIPLAHLMAAAALRDRLRTAAALPGAGTITLDDADLDAVITLFEVSKPSKPSEPPDA